MGHINASTKSYTLLSGAAEADSRDLKPSRTWDSEGRRREPSRRMSAVSQALAAVICTALPSVTFRIRSSLATSLSAGQHVPWKIWYQRRGGAATALLSANLLRGTGVVSCDGRARRCSRRGDVVTSSRPCWRRSAPLRARALPCRRPPRTGAPRAAAERGSIRRAAVP
jgi:hypothetical protein